MSEEYLQAVKRCVVQALIQTGKLARCENHHGVLLYAGDESDLHVAGNLARIQITDEAGVGFVMGKDLTDAVGEALAASARDGCPECRARQDQ